jgi:hypothetical protein
LAGATGAKGATGEAGAKGATGPTGPDNITTATDTNITGILKGDGSQVAAAVAGTDYQAAGNYPTSAEITVIKQLTAAAYASLTPKVSTTLYVIVG